MDSSHRNKIIIRTGISGIATNVLLSVFKALAGILSGSIAITLDAVNNLSDALSSVITILAAKFSEKPADRKHPLGYGRIEYLSAMLIACIVLFAGVTSLTESIRKIFRPEKTSYTMVTLLIVAVSIAVKLLLGHYTKKAGISVKSDSLIASGSDALFDAVVSFTTLISAAVTLLWNYNLDGFLGVIIAVVILRAGLGMLMNTLNDILGRRVDAQTAEEIRSEISSFEGVLGAYDLFLDSYGSQKLAGSVHIEVYNTMTAAEIDILTRNISRHIYTRFGILLTCGIYAVDMQNETTIALRQEITEHLKKHSGVLQIHGFHINEEQKLIAFDLVRDFSIQDVPAFLQELNDELTALHPAYQYIITPDLDISD